MPGLRTPDAAESNAGDEFHVLWAMRKSLELLNNNEQGLKAIAIEGLTKVDEDYISNEDILLGVDLTGYYGGRDFKSASKVEISQLKYSTRNPSKNWTPSELCTGKKGKKEGSIIHKLAGIFKAIYDTENREDVLQKLSVRLVSNRPASADIEAAINTAHNVIYCNEKGISLKDLHGALPKKSATILNTFFSAAGLPDIEFIDFITVFNLTDCNADSRYGIKQKVLEAITKTGNIDVKKEYNELYQLVKDKTLPEGQHKNTLYSTDILYMFGFADFSDLFPAGSSILRPTNLVMREQVQTIVDVIENLQTKLLLLHAGAGMGKSTMTELIMQNINKDHCVILFDCYGGGSYLDSDDKRHKHGNAFLQLSNELALKSGSPFLITRKLTNDMFLQEFQKRIKIASRFIKNANPLSQVVLIIDAADNSVYGASEYGEQSFVQDLLGMSIPEGCKIIFTSRTERRHILKLPAVYEEISILPFSFNETKSLLTPTFPGIKDEEVEEFRKMTKETPRVMAYAMAMPGELLQEKMNPLRPSGKSIDNIFKLMIDETAKKAGNKQAVYSFLESLINLPRPVPLNYVTLISGLSIEQLNDIQTDLWHGIIIKKDYFSFRDEDFENFLRKEYPRTVKISNAIADTFLLRAGTDEYASIHLGMALFNAGMSQTLQDIVLEKKYLHHPSDPIKNKEVQVERTRLAMKMNSGEGNKLNLIKLQMVAAEAAKTNSVLEQILMDKAELASSYGDLRMNQKLYFQSGNPAWFGHVHFKSAAIYSRNAATHELAKQHLNKAADWMEYRGRLEKKERAEFKISHEDIAYGAETVLRIVGAAECMNWLRSWKPREATYKAVEILLNNLAEDGDETKLKKWVKEISVYPTYQFLIVRILFEHGVKPPFKLTDLLNSFDTIEAVSAKTSTAFYKDIIAFCEYAAGEGAGSDELKRWLSLIKIEKPQYIPSFFESFYAVSDVEKHLMDIMFRKECLLAFFENKTLTVADFYPKSLADKLNGRVNQYQTYIDDEQRKFDTIYKHFLPIYETRVAFLMKAELPKILQHKLGALLKNVQQDYELRHYHKFGLNYILKFMAVKLADIAVWKFSDPLIQSIAAAFSTKEENNIILFLGLAKRISSLNRYHKDVFALLKKVDDTIELLTLPGDEQLSHFTEATIIAGRVSVDAGKYYFDKMVLSASVIDIEGQQQIRSVSKMILTEKHWDNPKLAYSMARFVEYSYESLKGFDHFPWHDGTVAVARLHPASAFAVICRWDHRGILNFEDFFTEIIEEGLNQNFLSPVQAAGILKINKYIFPELVKTIKKISEGFDLTGDYAARDTFLKGIIRELQLNFTAEHNFETLELFKEFIDSAKFLNKETVSEYREFYNQLSGLIKTQNKLEKEVKHLKKRNNPLRNYRRSIKKINLNSSEEIIELFEKLKKEAENNYIDFEQLFSDLRKDVKPENQVTHLDILISLEPRFGRFDFYSYEKAVIAAIKEWEINPAVLTWKAKAGSIYLKNKFSHYCANGYVSVHALKEVAAVFGFDEKRLSEIILNIIPDYLDELDASTLFQLLEITNYFLTKEEKGELLQWILPWWSEKIKDTLGDGPWDIKLIPPESSNFTLAYFLRYLLGHPQKSNRWRAAHTIRMLVSLKEAGIINCLFDLQNNVQNGIFQDGEFLFYFISAKLYLWISIERACRDNPAFFVSSAQQFFEELTNEELPHILIRHFIRNTCLMLEKYKKGLFKSDQLKIIKQLFPDKINRTNAPKVKHTGKRNTKFEFDNLDTIPYWYRPLAGKLQCNLSDLLYFADNFITEKWGYNGNGRDNDPAFSKKWETTSNRHGDTPSVEKLRIYFEYHAMFCAAGEILKMPDGSSKPDNDDDDDSLDYWISRHALYWEQYWLSDLRDPVPLLSKLWRKADTKGEWQWNINLKDFDSLIGLEDNDLSDDIPIWMRIRKTYGKDYEMNSINTALMNPEYAFSALLSIQTADRLNPYIPLEDNQDRYSRSKEDKRFNLKAWIKNRTSNGEGLDRDDEEFKNISKERLTVGEEFSKWAKLIFTDHFRFSYKGKESERWITKLETWSNGKNSDGYDNFSTEGQRLMIKKKDLMAFLKDTNQCLIINLEIERKVERRSGDSYFDPYSYLYLIYPNGTIKTISRTYKLG